MLLRFPQTLNLADHRAARMLAAGNVKVTVRSKATGQHITVSFSVRTGPHETGRKWRPASPGLGTQIFINAGARDRLGALAPYEAGGEVRWSYRQPYKPDHNLDSKRVWAAAAAMRWICGEDREDAEFQEANECGRCRAELTDPESIERGVGPICLGRMTKAQHQRREPDQRRLPLVESLEAEQARQQEKIAQQQRERVEDERVARQKAERDEALLDIDPSGRCDVYGSLQS